MDVDPVLEVIRQADLGFRQYQGVEELSDIQEGLKVLPAVFVVPVAMQGAANSHRVGITDQKITQRFSVTCLFKKLSRGELHAFEMGIMSALIGWTHPDMHGGSPGSPAEFANQRTFNLNGNLATSLDFTTSYHFRK